MTDYKKDGLTTDLNPTMFTARAVMMGGVSNGDKDAEKLLSFVEKDQQIIERNGPDGLRDLNGFYRFSYAYGIAAWIRSKISDRMFDSLKMLSFVDLGCGFNPRGLSFANRRYIHYYGFDLPPIIDRMKYAVMPSVFHKERVTYYASDVTDLESLRVVIRGNEPLFIVTEGLMMYLTENEMQTVVKNISVLLAEYGGVWFTGDPTTLSIYENMRRDFTGSDKDVMKDLLGAELSDKWIKLLYNNSFMKLKDDAFKDFVGKFGLDCKKVDVDSLIEGFNIPLRLRHAFENTSFIMMSPTETSEKHDRTIRSAFTIETEKENSVINVRLHGRLDSVNAPKLIEEYEKYRAEDPQTAVILDLADCPYISSAGLRAVSIIYKKTAGIEEGFSIRNIRPDVLEIFKMTSFTDLI